MRRAVLNTYIDLLGQADVLHVLRESPGQHVAFLGAGVSKEAGVPLAGEICDEIRAKLLAPRSVADPDAWAREHLSWNDPSRKYTACLDAYGSAEQRVAYFRSLLKRASPSFAHHAAALLMSHDVLFQTALTTNFDKLLERAFVEQALRECQAIRTEEEAEYWGEERDKCYVFKLHGDYDTHNILNTRPETRSVPGFFLPHSLNFFRAKGLLVLGCAANEESIVEFFKRILAASDARVLSGGVRWGVFVGSRRPSAITEQEELEHLKQAIEAGAVSKAIVELLGDMHDKYLDRRPCSFFPVWGSGNLLLQLIEVQGNGDLKQAAQPWLDHEMRLQTTFQEQGLHHEVIEKHIRNLRSAQRKIGQDPGAPARPVRQASRATSRRGNREVRVAYGDITSPATMGDSEFAGVRRAVVSPEDTTVSAGGGVALRLLTKAGPRYLLNELTKLGPIKQGTCVVTSAGNLPVHYIFHAAPLKIEKDGSYDINEESLKQAVTSVLKCAEALAVGALWIPLLGAGVADVPGVESLKSILSTIASNETELDRQCITVVIFQEDIVRPDEARKAMESELGPDFTVAEI